ncbi:MAG: hypothetical protein WC759_01375 [Candidatus Micrarchaeia archaeon]|jgi:hypothetical protein
MAEDLEEVLKKNEQGPLDKFRNESLIYKQFGGDGVRAYAAISPGIRARDLLMQLGMDEAKLMELLDFMDANHLISVQHAAIVPAPKPTYESMRKAEAEHEIVTEISQREQEVIVPEPETKRPASTPSPYSPAPQPSAPAPSPYAPPAQPSSYAPAAPRAPYSGYSRPSEEMITEVRPAGPAAPGGEIPTSTLSPLEKTIYQKFGRIGLTVYNLIDGEKTAEEILNETGISEVKLVEILEFMDKEGIIRLEKPVEEKAEPEKPKPRFEPMLEEKREAEETIEAEAVPIDLPIKHNQGFIKDLMLQGELLLRFPSFGLKAYNSMDGQSDVVQLASVTGASMEQLDVLLAFLGRRGGALMRPLKPKEVRVKYGDDGLAIYKKYGREGMLIYELIGKEGTVREIVQKSKMEKTRAVDIFIYIHKVLGLELPVDRQTLLQQIG